MKVRLTFTLDVDCHLDDLGEATSIEQFAQAKADTIIIQTMDATGYRMKLQKAVHPDVELISKPISN